MAKKKKSVFTRLTDKLNRGFIIEFYDDNSLEKVSTWKINIKSIVIFVLFDIIIIGFIVGLLLAYTPLGYMMPKYIDTKMKRQIVENALRMDSLQYAITSRDKYFRVIKNIVEGSDIENFTEAENDTSHIEKREIVFSKSKHDSLIRMIVQDETLENFSMMNRSESNENIGNLNFVMPLNGMIVNQFKPSEGHYGIDIVGSPDDPVMATLDGTIIMATWTLNTGYVIQIQHSNNLISIYKHNSVLLKSEGDHVKAGETIAIVGNSGELTTGPHLHFELWHNGVPVNPEDYIAF